MRAFLIPILLLFYVAADAQSTSSTAPVNAKDKAGQRDGFWYLQQPPRMGEPAVAEWGTYSHGLKTGVWYATDAQGELKSVERFRNDVRDGDAKYFERGRLVAAGPYRGLNPTQEWDTVMVENAVTGAISSVPVRTDRGSLRHGLWRFYDDQTGRLVREVEYQVDSIVYQKTFLLTSDDSTYYQRHVERLPHVKKPNTRTTRTVNKNLGY